MLKNVFIELYANFENFLRVNGDYSLVTRVYVRMIEPGMPGWHWSGRGILNIIGTSRSSPPLTFKYKYSIRKQNQILFF